VGSIATNGFVAKLFFRGNNQIKNFMKNVQSIFLVQVFQANNVASNLFFGSISSQNIEICL